MDYRLQLEIWRGNVLGAIQLARERNDFSDWIVAMAPIVSYDLWQLVGSEYAEKLEEEGNYHKAVTFLLASNKVLQAIELFKRHRLFKEAVALTKLRLSPVHPLLEDLYTEWGQSLMKDGHFEQAAQCYLAMRHREGAEILRSRHHYQCLARKQSPHTRIIAPVVQDQNILSSYKIVTQHLASGQWQDAHQFVHKHNSIKAFLPLLSTHQLLIQQLTSMRQGLTLINRPIATEKLLDLGTKKHCKSRIEFPEFLVDKSEMDPVVPWEPFLIEEQTFPHHLLKIWHQRSIVTMSTHDLKAMYASMSQILTRRQNADDLANTLVQVSLDLTLCLLALLMSETSNAITHYLQAMSFLHIGHHKLILQAVCRLMLPQGPKYLLKLQQEFTACRVLITMESLGDENIAGSESHNSFKKFLTDIKDDNAISMSTIRCRELDCLRAYYYLAILDYLYDEFTCAQYENESHDGMPNNNVSDSQNDNSKALITQNLDNLSLKEGELTKCDHNNQQLEDVTKPDQDLTICEIPKLEMCSTKWDINDNGCNSSKPKVLTNNKTHLKSICSTLPPQYLTQICSVDSNSNCQNKDIDKCVACNISTSNVTQIESYNNQSDNSYMYCRNSFSLSITRESEEGLSHVNKHKPLSTTSFKEHYGQIACQERLSFDSSSVDPLVEPLKMSTQSTVNHTSDAAKRRSTSAIPSLKQSDSPSIITSSILHLASPSPSHASPILPSSTSLQTHVTCTLLSNFASRFTPLSSSCSDIPTSSNAPLTNVPSTLSPLTMSIASPTYLSFSPLPISSSTISQSSNLSSKMSLSSHTPLPLSKSLTTSSNTSSNFPELISTPSSIATSSDSPSTLTSHSYPIVVSTSTQLTSVSVSSFSNVFSMSCMSLPSNSLHQTIAQGVSISSTTKPTSKSPLSKDQVLSSLKYISSGKGEENGYQENTCCGNVEKATVLTNNGDLNYRNLLRLSKGVLWDMQAKQEALTQTLGYIHQAISYHLLNKHPPINSYNDTFSIEAFREKHSETCINGIDEDGGYSNTFSESVSLLPVANEKHITKLQSPHNQNPQRNVLNSVKTESALSSTIEHDIQNAGNRGPISMNNIIENDIVYQKPSWHSIREDYPCLKQIEQEPMVFKKSRKVLWMDGKETSTGVCLENMHSCDVSRQAPDGSTIPIEWDDLPVDKKYCMPYVSLSLLKQEQESITQELKRGPDMSEILFPRSGDSIKSLLNTSLASPYMSVKEKRKYFQHLNDWASLFSVTSSQQEETAAMFAKAAEEFLKDK